MFANNNQKDKFVSHPTGVHSRSFKTDTEGVYNHVSLESSWDMAKGVLGEEGQQVFADEAQDQESGFFAMLYEIMTQSEYKWMFVSGTARDPSSDLADFWKSQLGIYGL